jgi:hypothetical protein
MKPVPLLFRTQKPSAFIISLGVPHGSLRILSSMATPLSKEPRKFAPLSGKDVGEAPTLRGVVFDVDGTLW